MGITEEDLQRAHKSTPYNPLIANAFFRSGQIEAWGRGIEKIKAACAADSLPDPEFRISPTEFMICFHMRNNNKTIAGRVTEKEKNIVPSGTINGTIIPDENNNRLLNAILENPAITYDGLSMLLGMPRRTVSREMKKLQEIGKMVIPLTTVKVDISLKPKNLCHFYVAHKKTPGDQALQYIYP